MFPREIIGTEEKDEGGIENTKKSPREIEEEKIKLQQEATIKQSLRTNTLGNILRSKGFIWTPHTHDEMVAYGQAGNIITMGFAGSWGVLDPKTWTGPEEDKASFRQNLSGVYGDRRQELVFIGERMNHEIIQKELDSCLLTDEEFELGVDDWKALDFTIEILQ